MLLQSLQNYRLNTNEKEGFRLNAVHTKTVTRVRFIFLPLYLLSMDKKYFGISMDKSLIT